MPLKTLELFESWTLAEAMHQVVLHTIKVTVDKSLFLTMNCDEVTSIDNQS
jgi:hypothetical protein